MCAKFKVSGYNRSRDIEGSQNFKTRSRDTFSTPFDLILHFYLEPLVANLLAKFEVSSYVRDMEGVPKF